ncbi:MAG: hypothetical protein DMG06_05200 [Acidobacteria bacterium]|nr:MAG: hypothetical protein DMG06_05200 [Acidobacteriota bacterium]
MAEEVHPEPAKNLKSCGPKGEEQNRNMVTTLTEEDQIVDTMVEAELYVKYECYPQALELLDKVINRYPRYLPAKEALAGIFRRTGQSERADEILREINLISSQMAEEGCQKDVEGGSGAAKVDERRQLVEKIDGIIKEIYDSNYLAQILKISASQLVQSLAADRCIIIRLGQDEGQPSTHEYCNNGIPSSLDGKTARLNFLLLKKVSTSLDPVAVDDAFKDPTLAGCKGILERFNIRALMACPLVYKSKLVGLILVHRCTNATGWSDQERTLFTTVAGHIVVAISNSQQVSADQTMEITDKLTGLYNRQFFEERLSAELRNAQLQNYPLCLAFLNIDHFKEISDTPAAGDKVLHKLGFLVRTNLRKGSVVARFSGEEFVVILPNTRLKMAHQIMDHIRKIVEKTITTDSGNPVTISVGVKEAGLQDKKDLDVVQKELIQRAHESLHRAKRSGREDVRSN